MEKEILEDICEIVMNKVNMWMEVLFCWVKNSAYEYYLDVRKIVIQLKYSLAVVRKSTYVEVSGKIVGQFNAASCRYAT